MDDDGMLDQLDKHGCNSSSSTAQFEKLEDVFQETLQIFHPINEFLIFASSCKGFNINHYDIKILQEKYPDDVEKLKWEIFGLWRQRQKESTAPFFRNLVENYLQSCPEALRTEASPSTVTFMNSVHAGLYVHGARVVKIGNGEQSSGTEMQPASETPSRARPKTNVTFNGPVTVDALVTETDEVILDRGYLHISGHDEAGVADEREETGKTTEDEMKSNEEHDENRISNAEDVTLRDTNSGQRIWSGFFTSIRSSNVISVVSFSVIALVLLTRVRK